MSHFVFHKIALAGLLLFGPQFHAQAQTISTSAPMSVVTTGIVGVTAMQTARLNVLNLQPIIPGVTAVVCPATLEFYDDTGALLKQLAVTNISPASAASLAFKPPVGARAQIRAVVLTPSPFVLTPGSGPISTPVLPMPIFPVSRGCSVMASLEIIDDSTGVTHAFTTDLRTMPTYGIIPMMAPGALR